MTRRTKSRSTRSAPRISKRALRGFSAPAHVARVAVGLLKQDKVNIVSPADVKYAREQIRDLTGGATVWKGEGDYRHKDGTPVEEATAVFEVISFDSCSKFKKDVRNAARRIARRLDQESVLVGVQCAGDQFDVTFEEAVSPEDE